MAATDLPAPDAAWALFLDVDGTLLDLAPTPDAVVVPPSLPADLRAAHAALGGAVAILSGRPLATIDALLGWAPRAAGGVHGAEVRLPDGGVDRAVGDAAAAALEAARARLVALAGDGVLVEDKGVAVAVHVRLAPEREPAVGAAVRALAAGSHGALDAMPGHRVWELRPRAASKGAALARLLLLPPFVGRVPVMVGDDVTDEAAMDVAVAHGGLALRVGAQRGIPPARVRGWLASVADAAGARPPG